MTYILFFFMVLDLYDDLLCIWTVAQLCRRYTRAVELHLPGSLLDIPVRESLRTLR
jgi:hypothetical protein